MNDIHPTAIIDKGVELGENISVGAYAIIGSGAKIGNGCIVEAHAKITSYARISDNCRICSFAVVGGEPQDLHFDSSIKSYVEIGEGSVVRESSTIHRATVSESSTKIGKNALLMASSHVGHDCVIGDNCIIACFSALGGHVHIGNDVFVSGGVMVHQRVRVGDGVIISGNAAISMDVPPYTISFERNLLSGLNLVGMNRRKMPRDEIAEVKSLYMQIYKETSPRKTALSLLESGVAKTFAGKNFLEFFKEEHRYLAPRAKGDK